MVVFFFKKRVFVIIKRKIIVRSFPKEKHKIVYYIRNDKGV